MATSKCPKCESFSFESVVHEPHGSNVKVTFIQCSMCGAVVGTMEFFNISGYVQKIANKLGVK